MKTRLHLILFIFVICISLTACQQNSISDLQLKQQDFNAEKANYRNNDDILDSGPVKGGTLNLFSTTPDTLNPVLTKNVYVNDFLGFIYEGLVKLNEKQKAIPILSDTWRISSDGLIWDFHIRKGVKWSDGQDLSAEDVAYTVEYLASLKADTVYQKLIENIETYAATDSSNFKVVLKKPDSFTPEMMTFPIMPKHLMKKASDPANFIPVGTGPYMFASYQKDKNVMFKRNDKWWYNDTAEGKTKNSQYIENINIKIYDSSSDAVNAFQIGDIDAMCISFDEFKKYDGRNDLLIKKYVSRDFEFLAFNLYNPVLADLSVRRAIDAAIDKNKILKETMGGNAIQADLPVSPNCWLFDDIKGEAAPTSSPRDLLLEGGWKESVNGFSKSFKGIIKKLDFELLVNDNNSRRVLIAEKICEQLKTAGINAVVKKMSWNEMVDQIDKTKFDMAYMGCRTTQIPDVSFLYSNSYFTSYNLLQADTGRNISGYSNDLLKDYIDMLYRDNNESARKTDMSNIKTVATNDLPYIGFCFLKNGVIYKKNVRGNLAPYTWNRYYDITQWYKPEL